MLASELLTQVRRLGALPSSSNAALADADILGAADMVVQSRLLPLLRSLNEDYLVRYADVASASGRVDLPLRATAAGVRHVQLVFPGQGIKTLPRLSLERVTGIPVTGYPAGWYFDGGGIVLVPIGTSGTLRVHYYARPGKLTTAGALISSVAADTPTAGQTRLTFGLGYTPGSTVDIVSQGPAHEHLAINIATSNVTGTTADVPTASLLGAVRAGDYICAPDTSMFVALPEEMASALVSLVVARCLRALDYAEAASMHEAAADAEEARLKLLLAPRSDGNPKRLTGGTIAKIGANWREQWRW